MTNTPEDDDFVDKLAEELEDKGFHVRKLNPDDYEMQISPTTGKMILVKKKRPN